MIPAFQHYSKGLVHGPPVKNGLFPAINRLWQGPGLHPALDRHPGQVGDPAHFADQDAGLGIGRREGDGRVDVHAAFASHSLQAGDCARISLPGPFVHFARMSPHLI